MNHLPLILASSSIGRQKLLSSLQIPFKIIIPDIDETPELNETPTDLVMRLAEQKARKVASETENALIIGSDQVCFLNEECVSKPLTRDNAIAQLSAASGRTICFYTGLCLLNTQTQKCQLTVDVTKATFRTLSLLEIETYIDRENPLHCAGSFNAEGLGMGLFEKLSADDPSAIIGLPLIALARMLRAEQVNILLTI